MQNKTPVPLLDLKAQYASIKSQIDAAVAEVFESQYFILGPKVKECEEKIAAYSQCQYGVGVSSGSDALLISLMAEGIGPGDEVITTPYTFFATVGCISRVGATPVFADIDPLTYNIDPSLIEAAVTDRTKAIIPVHLYGQCADMDPIMDIAQRHSLTVIEDAAQAIGAEYKGRRAGSIGHYGCFSFFPSKNLGCAGDGGMVVINDESRAERLRILRAHGSKPKYYHSMIGGNFRLDALQAAIVTVKLNYLDTWTAARQSNATRYRMLFTQSGLVEKGVVTLPYDASLSTDADASSSYSLSPLTSQLSPCCRHIYNQFVIRVPRRDELRAYLKDRSIGNEVYYPVPLHMQECFASLGHHEGEFPNSENAAYETIALPVYPELTDEQADCVVDRVLHFCDGEPVSSKV